MAQKFSLVTHAVLDIGEQSKTGRVHSAVVCCAGKTWEVGKNSVLPIFPTDPQEK